MPVGIEPWWHTAGIALIITLFVIRRWVASKHIVLICLVELPGVSLHELLHLLTGIVFNANPCGFNLVPERNNRYGGWTLGSVEFGRITTFNAVPIALAPLLLLPLAYGAFRYWYLVFPYPTLSNTLGLYALSFVFTSGSIPSRQDIRVACNWRSLLLYSSVVVGVVVWSLWRSGL